MGGHELMVALSASFLVVYGIIPLVFYSFLIHGTSKKHPGLTNAWLIFMYIWLGIMAVGMIISLFSFNVISLIGQIAILALLLFFVSVVRSYRLELVNQNQSQELQSKTHEYENRTVQNNFPPTYTQAVDSSATLHV